MSCQSPIVVALDYPTIDQATAMAKRLDPKLCRVKVGKELFTKAGPAILEELHKLDFDVFLDLKFHDIPNTVANAVSVAAKEGVTMRRRPRTVAVLAWSTRLPIGGREGRRRE